MRLKTIVPSLVLTLLTSSVGAQTPTTAQTTPPPRPIQDNSFLIEEAYNQDSGVIQHISTFSRSWDTKNWIYTFTEEWPLHGLKHQISATIPAFSVSSPKNSGIGDIAINYRYQLTGGGDSKLSIAPRFSVLLPTGNSRRGLGAGATGIQLNVPLSWVVTPRIVTHSNAGMTYIPSAKNRAGDKADLKGFNLGQSLVWLAHQQFNVMFEAAWNRMDSVAGPGLKDRGDSVFLNPGFRWSHDFENGLQIVPGIAFPVGVGPSRGDVGVLFYLSFEHPIKR